MLMVKQAKNGLIAIHYIVNNKFTFGMIRLDTPFNNNIIIKIIVAFLVDTFMINKFLILIRI